LRATAYTDCLDVEDDLLQELDFDTRLPLLTALMSKMACNKSTIWVLPRLPFPQPGQSVTLVFSLKPIAAPQRLSAEAGTRRPYRLRPPLRGRYKLCKLVVRRTREIRLFKTRCSRS
jgi:hypothetical protein